MDIQETDQGTLRDGDFIKAPFFCFSTTSSYFHYWGNKPESSGSSIRAVRGLGHDNYFISTRPSCRHNRHTAGRTSPVLKLIIQEDLVGRKCCFPGAAGWDVPLCGWWNHPSLMRSQHYKAWQSSNALHLYLVHVLPFLVIFNADKELSPVLCGCVVCSAGFLPELLFLTIFSFSNEWFFFKLCFPLLTSLAFH